MRGIDLRGWVLVAVVTLLAAGSYRLFAPDEAPRQRGERPKQSDRLSNLRLQDQHGEDVRFYDDLVRDRTVLVNLMFSGCGDVCPANSAALARLHDLLGSRMGRDIFILSLSIDPYGDTPDRLHQYWRAFGARPGWHFLTGEPGVVERLRRDLGLYDLDPDIDADPTQHSGLLTIGNDRTDRWAALPVLMDPKLLAKTVLHIAGGLAPAPGDPARGRQAYGTYCAACHGVAGEGDGPLTRLLPVVPPRHSDAAYMGKLSDAYLFRLLKEGGPAVGKSPLMNAWGNNLSDERIGDVIAYLRTLAGTTHATR